MTSISLSEYQVLGMELSEIRQRSIDLYDNLYKIFGDRISGYLSSVIGFLYKAVPHVHDEIDHSFGRVEADNIIHRNKSKPEKINLPHKNHSKLNISEYRTIFCALDAIEDLFSSMKCFDTDSLNWEKIDEYLTKLRYRLSLTAFRDTGIRY